MQLSSIKDELLYWSWSLTIQTAGTAFGGKYACITVCKLIPPLSQKYSILMEFSSMH